MALRRSTFTTRCEPALTLLLTARWLAQRAWPRRPRCPPPGALGANRRLSQTMRAALAGTSSRSRAGAPPCMGRRCRATACDGRREGTEVHLPVGAGSAPTLALMDAPWYCAAADRTAVRRCRGSRASCLRRARRASPPSNTRCVHAPPQAALCVELYTWWRRLWQADDHLTNRSSAHAARVRCYDRVCASRHMVCARLARQARRVSTAGIAALRAWPSCALSPFGCVLFLPSALHVARRRRR